MSKAKPEVATDPALRTVSSPALLVDGSDAAFRRMIHTLMAIGNSVGTMQAGFAQVIGISAPQHELLMLIYRTNDGQGIGVGELAAMVKLTSAFVATETRKLSAAGLIEKIADRIDRRRITLRVSALGLQRLAFLSAYQRQVNDAFFACFDDRAFERFSRYLEQVLPCGERAADLITNIARDMKKSKARDGRAPDARHVSKKLEKSDA